MTKKKYQVFVSSTFDDLQHERDSVIKAILEMGHIPIGMEMFSAADAAQWKVIARHIRESDYYVLVVANRYGSTSRDGTSFTQKEFNYAVKSRIPILSFLLKGGVRRPFDRGETKPDAKKRLLAFKNKAAQSRLVCYWRNKEDLSAMVAMSLQKAIDNTPRDGWVKWTESMLPDHGFYVRRGQIHWSQFNDNVRRRYWAAGTSLIGMIERKILERYVAQGVTDITVE